MHRDIGMGDPSRVAVHRGRSVIAVIGIDHYAYWPRLANAVADAVGIARLFTQLGFSEVVPPLLDAEANGPAMRRLVTDDLARLSPDDSLVLFFAGHGHTHTAQLGSASLKTGYLVPVDAERPGGQVATLIRLDSWLSDVSRLPPRHILVIIDACHSGVALGSLVKWRDAVAPVGTLDELQRRLSRRIITSALDDQRALDSGPYPQHSLFTGCLIEGLQGGLAKHGQQVATGSEIALYVQRRVTTYPSSTQTPDFGALEFDDRGELIVPIAAAHPPVEVGAMHSSRASAKPTHPPRRRWLVAPVIIAAACGLALVIGKAFLPGAAGGQPQPPVDTARVAASADAAVDSVGPPAYAVYTAACTNGDATACENALHLLLHSSDTGSRELYRLAMACDAKEAPCVARALIEHNQDLAARSCVAGVPTACLLASSLIDPPTEQQDSDVQRALNLIVDDMIDARFLRSFLLAFGLGMPRTPGASRQLMAQGCQVGDIASCGLQRCLNPDGDPKKRMNDLVACGRAGVLPKHLVDLGKDALMNEIGRARQH